MLRSAILCASENRFLRRWFESSASASRLTRRFVAGNSLEEATHAVAGLVRDGLLASLDALGESVKSEDEAKRAAQQYVDSVQRIHELALPSTVSLKLTQLGLGISPRVASDNLVSIVEAGRRAGVRVEVDMEASEHVDATLDLVKDCHDRLGCIRAVMQAYLYRTEKDIRELNALRIPVRLCKGAYKEDDAIAWPRKADVDENYRKLTSLVLAEGTLPAIATHDERMLQHAVSEIRRLGLRSDQYEFQMLYGIRRDLQRKLAADGSLVRVYVPYGEAWYPYLMRRMAERPANLLFVLRNSMR